MKMEFGEDAEDAENAEPSEELGLAAEGSNCWCGGEINTATGV